MIHKQKVDMVVISEPIVNMNKVDVYMRYLGFNHCKSNINGKIWCFWRDNCNVSITQDHDQHITMEVLKNQNSDGFFVTTVYAKCKKNERKELWASLEGLNKVINKPWTIGGDFNVILHPEEKLGGLPHRSWKSYDFLECMDSCGMTDIG